MDPETGSRNLLVGPPHLEAYALYIIPEVSKEDEKANEAAERNEEYDPCTDDALTLEQITKYIYDQDA